MISEWMDENENLFSQNHEHNLAIVNLFMFRFYSNIFYELIFAPIQISFWVSNWVGDFVKTLFHSHLNTNRLQLFFSQLFWNVT